MSEVPYGKGTVKVVWIENDAQHIYSRMFASVDDAVAFVPKHPDCLVFSLVSQENMEVFEWELLPYGRSSLYTKLFRLYRNNEALVTSFIERL